MNLIDLISKAEEAGYISSKQRMQISKNRYTEEQLEEHGFLTKKQILTLKKDMEDKLPKII